jgi:hypothetical protein
MDFSLQLCFSQLLGCGFACHVTHYIFLMKHYLHAYLRSTCLFICCSSNANEATHFKLSYSLFLSVDSHRIGLSERISQRQAQAARPPRRDVPSHGYGVVSVPPRPSSSSPPSSSSSSSLSPQSSSSSSHRYAASAAASSSSSLSPPASSLSSSHRYSTAAAASTSSASLSPQSTASPAAPPSRPSSALSPPAALHGILKSTSKLPYAGIAASQATVAASYGVALVKRPSTASSVLQPHRDQQQRQQQTKQQHLHQNASEASSASSSPPPPSSSPSTTPHSVSFALRPASASVTAPPPVQLNPAFTQHPQTRLLLAARQQQKHHRAASAPTSPDPAMSGSNHGAHISASGSGSTSVAFRGPASAGNVSVVSPLQRPLTASHSPSAAVTAPQRTDKQQKQQHSRGADFADSSQAEEQTRRPVTSQV